jgi:dihydrofolate reductase
MARVRVRLAVSADGLIATDDRSLDWLAPFPAGEFGISSFINSIGTIVMGRTCYDEGEAIEPSPFTAHPTFVVTSRALSPRHPNIKPISLDNLAATITELKRGDKDIWLFGGGQTIAACLERKLVDTLELAVIPRLLGRGLPLFTPRAPALDALTLVEAKPMTKDVLWLHYSIAH